MLDYFKDIEYIWLEEFIDALWRFEGRGKAIEKWYDRFTRDPKKEAERKLGVLEDFVGWFWGRVVVDLSWMKVVVDDGYKCPLVSQSVGFDEKISGLKVQAILIPTA